MRPQGSIDVGAGPAAAVLRSAGYASPAQLNANGEDGCGFPAHRHAPVSSVATIGVNIDANHAVYGFTAWRSERMRTVIHGLTSAVETKCSGAAAFVEQQAMASNDTDREAALPTLIPAHSCATAVYSGGVSAEIRTHGPARKTSIGRRYLSYANPIDLTSSIRKGGDPVAMYFNSYSVSLQGVRHFKRASFWSDPGGKEISVTATCQRHAAFHYTSRVAVHFQEREAPCN